MTGHYTPQRRITALDSGSGVLTMEIDGIATDFVEVSRLLDVLAGDSSGREWWRNILSESLDAVTFDEPHEINQSTAEGSDMRKNTGRTPKVKTKAGKSLSDGRVSFKSGARPGPAGSGAARNARLQGRSTS